MNATWARVIVIHVMREAVPHGFKWGLSEQVNFATGCLEVQVSCAFERIQETRPIHEDITPRQAVRLAKAMVHRVLMRLNPPRPDQAEKVWDMLHPGEQYQKGWRDPRTLSPAWLQVGWDEARRVVLPAPCESDNLTRPELYAAVRRVMSHWR